MPVHDPHTILPVAVKLLTGGSASTLGEIRKAIAGGFAAAGPLTVADLADMHISSVEAGGIAAAFVAGAFAVFKIRNADAPDAE